MGNQDLEQKTQGRKPRKLRKILDRAVLASVLVLATLIGVNGYISRDREEFYDKPDSTKIKVYDKDGIKKAQIIDSNGNVVYDILGSKFYEFVSSTSMFSGFPTSDFPKRLEWKCSCALDPEDQYFLRVEDTKGNVMIVPRIIQK